MPYFTRRGIAAAAAYVATLVSLLLPPTVTGWPRATTSTFLRQRARVKIYAKQTMIVETNRKNARDQDENHPLLNCLINNGPGFVLLICLDVVIAVVVDAAVVPNGGCLFVCFHWLVLS